jgi:O-antigen/teichoic acid export membrane protein
MMALIRVPSAGSVKTLVANGFSSLCILLLVVAASFFRDASAAGAMVIYLSVRAIAIVVASLGIPEHILIDRSVSGRNSSTVRERSLLTTCLCSTIAVGAVLVALRAPLGRWLSSSVDSAGGVAQVILVTGAMLPLSAIYIAVSRLSLAHDQTSFLVLERIGRSSLTLVVMSVGLAFGPVPLGWVVFAGEAAAAPFLLYFWKSTRMSRHRPGFYFSTNTLGVAARYARSVVSTMLTWTDTLVVAALLSPADAATYAIASRSMIFFTMSRDAVAQSLLPAATEELRLRGSASQAFRQGQRDLIAMSLPLSGLVLTAVATGWLFGIVDGEVAATGGILLAGACVAAAAGPTQTLMTIATTQVDYLRLATLALVTQVTLDVLLIPLYGLPAAALAWSTALVALAWAPRRLSSVTNMISEPGVCVLAR